MSAPAAPTTTHKIRTACKLDLPLFGSRDESLTLDPPVVAFTWTVNDHLHADELRLTLDWSDAGIDPRTLRNARCLFWAWDAALEDFDPDKHLRFAGIAQDVERGLSGDASHVTLRCADWTCMFLGRPLPQQGVPRFDQSLREAWAQICDHVGYWDVETQSIVSSVEALRDQLDFRSADADGRSIGDTVPERYRLIGAPSFAGAHANAWKVWTSLVGSMGFHTFVDRDRIVVVRASDFYDDAKAAVFQYGTNILSIEERVDTAKTTRGIILRTWDPTTMAPIEAIYPAPGDPSLKSTRVAAGRSKKNRKLPGSEDFDIFTYPALLTQDALDDRAKEAYEERSRQELEGKITTAETRVFDAQGNPSSVFDLRTGQGIKVQWDIDDEDEVHARSPADQVRHYMDRGYSQNTAEFLVENIKRTSILSDVHHVKAMTVDLTAERYEVSISYHNRIKLSD